MNSARTPGSSRSKPSAANTAPAIAAFIELLPDAGLHGRQKRRPLQEDLQEVVEVPDLQRGILAVVGKTEHLLGFGAQLGVLLVEVAQRSEGQHGGGRATPFTGERGQAQRIAPGRVMGHSAVQAKAEAARDVPTRDASIVQRTLAVEPDVDRLPRR
jgi:hypothetical protein